MDYGLIGQTLKHSFSKPVHEALTDYQYQLCPLATQEIFHDFMTKKEFKGINVTIPYKLAVIPYCDEVHPQAAEIGTVNTIVNKNGVLVGYNTDYLGFLYLADKMGLDFSGKTVLILGTGGTFQTVRTAVTQKGAKTILVASRTAKEGVLDYATAQSRQDVQIIVNTTPVGMYPDNQSCPISLEGFPQLEGVIDAVYNPLRSTLVQQGKRRGIPANGGLAMLVAQAKYAAELFQGKEVSVEAVERVTGEIFAAQSNLVMIGMPASGKSTLGRRCAQDMNRTFIDLDNEIVEEIGMPIPQFFQEQGEAAFRAIEHRLCLKFAKETGQVISTGGGVVLNPENIAALQQNGVLALVQRPLEELKTGGNRPLLPDQNAVETLYQQRWPLYQSAQDFAVDNVDQPGVIAERIQEAFYEVFSVKRP